MSYKLAIFDLDGTILNTIDDLSASANYICSSHGYKTHSVEEYKYFVGNGIPKLVKRFLPSDVNEDEYKNLLNEFIEYYASHSAINTRPYEGIENLLKDLHEKGIKLAVNTNKIESAAVVLCKDYFPNMFDIVSGGKEGMPPKPAPDGVCEILKKAGISKEDAKSSVVYIGDSDVDIQTAKNTGIAAIAVDWGFRGAEFLKAHGAEKIVFSADELYKMIAE